jgi:hypothetical protein
MGLYAGWMNRVAVFCSCRADKVGALCWVCCGRLKEEAMGLLEPVAWGSGAFGFSGRGRGGSSVTGYIC